MLRELSVQNLALIEDLRVELRAGYCAWTGETGAGKSLLLTALGLVLGGRASSELVRAGKVEARASAIFDVGEPGLKGELEAILGGAIDDETLILTRRVSASGRGSAQANGVPVTVATLQALGARLIDIHGQNDGRALMEPEHQRGLLDAHGGLGPLAANYRQRRSEHEQLRRRRLELIGRREESARERALLEFERDELAGAEPRMGEAEELAREAQRLAGAEEVRVAAAGGYASLYEADLSAQELLGRVARSLGALRAIDPAIAEASETLERLADETREVAYSLRDMGKCWEDDPARLDLIEERLSLYRRLASRFHCKVDDLAAKRVEVETKLEALERDVADLSSLEGPIREAWGALKGAAEALSAGRRKTAKGFAKAIQGKLRPLGLESARFEASITTIELGSDFLATGPADAGVDRVEFVFSANPGETPLALRKVASGGEISRVTLAIKTVLAGVDKVPTLVFDEIDAGVGGRLGGVLGKTLAELSKHHQVVCVTHLPQMASYAEAQWVIRKRVERGRTRTTITPLGKTDRVVELAAMLRGDSAAEGTRQEAMAMLAEAQTRH